MHCFSLDCSATKAQAALEDTLRHLTELLYLLMIIISDVGEGVNSILMF